MVCEKCNKEFPEGKFCPFCGTKNDKVSENINENSISEPTEENREEKVSSVEKNENKKGLNPKIIVAVGGVAVVLAVILLLVFRKDPVTKFVGFAENGEYINANEIYAKKIAGNVDSENEVYGYLNDYLSSSWNAYIGGESSADELDKVLEKLHKIEGNEKIKSELSIIDDKYQTVKDSEEAYKSGKSKQDSGDFLAAIAEYSKVSKEDAFSYDAAQAAIQESKTNYADNLVEEAENCISSKQYTEAVNALEEAEKYIDNKDGIVELKTQALTLVFESNIKNYVESDSFAKAKACYEEAQKSEYCTVSDAMTKLYEDYMEKTRKSYLDSSKEIYKESGYLAATEVIREGLQKFPGDDTLKKYEELFMSAEPVYVKTLPVMDKHCLNDVGEREDKFGNSYADCFGLSTMNVYDTPNRAYVKYLTGKQYTTLTLKAFNDTSNSESQICVRVIADDLKIYESGYFTNQDKTKEITLDITNVEALEINANHMKGHGSGDAMFADAYVYRELTDEDFDNIE